MANRGREYAEELVGALDRGAYNQQRDVAKATYNTNWENVQNQYKNLQDKLKLQQQRANRDFAEGLVNVAENSFNRERQGSGNLANRGLSVSGLTNMLNQADTAQKGEDIGNLLKTAGAISADTAGKLSQATSKAASEETGLLGKLADTLGDIGDAETALQNRYNNTLAGIAGAMDEREANNALQAAQRAARGGGGSGKSQELVDAENALDEFYRKAAINEVLASPDMDDQQKSNYLGIMFGINGSGNIVDAYNKNVNATNDYNTRLNELQTAANKQQRQNSYAQNILNQYNRSQQLQNNLLGNRNAGVLPLNGSSRYTMEDVSLAPRVTFNYDDINALNNFKNQGITYEDLAQLLYGNK